MAVPFRRSRLAQRQVESFPFCLALAWLTTWATHVCGYENVDFQNTLHVSIERLHFALDPQLAPKAMAPSRSTRSKSFFSESPCQSMATLGFDRVRLKVIGSPFQKLDEANKSAALVLPRLQYGWYEGAWPRSHGRLTIQSMWSNLRSHLFAALLMTCPLRAGLHAMALPRCSGFVVGGQFIECRFSTISPGARALGTHEGTMAPCEIEGKGGLDIVTSQPEHAHTHTQKRNQTISQLVFISQPPLSALLHVCQESLCASFCDQADASYAIPMRCGRIVAEKTGASSSSSG